MLSLIDGLNENRNLKEEVWTNWSGVVSMKPSHILYPRSVEEVRHFIRLCALKGRKLRVIGSGHSFTPLVETQDVLVSLDQLHGVGKVDEASRSVEVYAGTKLKDLSAALYSQGWAQENLGDIDSQSIGGAIGTGTHGTGIAFGSLSTQLLEIQVVTTSGEVVTCSRDRYGDLYRALQVSLGLLGIIVKVKLRVVPLMKLKYESSRLPLEDCLGQLPGLKERHRHFEFFWFPHTDTVQVKCLNETDEPAAGKRFWNDMNQMVMENALFGLLSESCRVFPRLSKSVSRLSARFVPTGQDVAYSHQLFTTKRLVRFNEMEYSVPAESMEAVVREIRNKVTEKGYAVHFPVECRYVKGDDIWLSPAYERDSAYIAVHMYKGMEYREYFADMESIFRRYGGRPHWGKMHTCQAEDLKAVYPRWEEFRMLCKELDPKGTLRNDYLRVLFGWEK